MLALFHTIIEKCIVTTNKLSPFTGIAQNPLFDTATESSIRESANILGLSIEENDRAIEYDGSSFVVHTLKKQSFWLYQILRKYIDITVSLPRSNNCERLFLKARFTLFDRRKELNPIRFTSQIFLYFNNDLWGITDLNKRT